MSALKLKLRAEPPQRVDLTQLSPSKLKGSSIAEIEKLVIVEGKKPIIVADCFSVSGEAGEALHLEGGSSKLDFVGAGNEGDVIVEGDVGSYAGRQMKSGTLEIRGNAGSALASNLRGGKVIVRGNAGERIGHPRPGEKDGINGGTVIVLGDAGDFASERMRRGTLIVKGQIGKYTGSRMMGGTIYAEQGLSEGAGVQMRRGTIIGPTLERQLATFVDCGTHDLLILKIMERFWRETIGELAPPAITSAPRRLMGDMSSLGKGEILLTAG